MGARCRITVLFLTTERALVLLPPLLSLLPSLSFFVNTYLQDRDKDHRVLVLCENLKHAALHIYRIIESVFGQNYILFWSGNGDSEQTCIDFAKVVVARLSDSSSHPKGHFCLVIFVFRRESRRDSERCAEQDLKVLGDGSPHSILWNHHPWL
jgi:hypothetical protein